MIAMTLITLGLYAQAVADTVAVTVQGVPDMPGQGAGPWDWLLWAVPALIAVGQFMVKMVPTVGKSNIFQVVYKALVWILKILDSIVPDRKKGGGTH